MVIIIALMLALFSTSAFAAEYYVAQTGGSDANNCTAAQSISTPKATLASAFTCWVGGDTIWVRTGTYTATINTSIPSGISNTQRTVLSAWNNEAVTVNLDGATTHGIEISNKANITLYGIDWNEVFSTTRRDAIKIVGSTATNTYSENITVAGPPAVNGVYKCKVRNGGSNGISVQGPTRNIRVDNCDVFNNALLVESSPWGHGMYVQRTEGFVMTGNRVHGNGCNGIQVFPTTKNAVLRGNMFGDNNTLPACGTDVILSNSGHLFENNIIYRTTGTGTIGLRLQYGDTAPPSNMTVRNNTFYAPGVSQCVYFAANATNNLLINNILLGCTTAIVDDGTSNTKTTNLTSGTATAILTDPVNGDYTLKAGSAAINAGTSTGLAFCESAPDQGAFEQPIITAASINGNTLDVTICSAFPPVQLGGTWTVGCTGGGCGSRTVTSKSVLGSGIARLTIDGAPCAAGQTWTVSASGNNTDSALVGNQHSQVMKNETNFAVNSSACTGSGPPGAPVGSAAIYNFENNLNDSSGNGNHAIGSAAISYVAGHDMQGVNTTSGVNSYVDTGLLNGFNPTTSHLFVGVWVRISTLGVRRMIGGVEIGTNQRFYIRQDNDNVWDFGTQAVVSPTNTEFPVVTGDTFIGVKFRPSPTNTATLCVNGVEGVNVGSSVQNITSYTFPSTFRLGLPNGFATTLSSNHMFDQLHIYTTDVSCADVYNGTQPPPAAQSATQVSHQWERTHTVSGSPVNHGAEAAAVDVVTPGGIALVVQYNNESGGQISLQPRFRYNVNGGAFANVPDSPTSDGVYYWGASTHPDLNNGPASGPLDAGLTHTNGITLLSATGTPTVVMPNNTSQTIRGVFRFTADAAGKTICFKLYDQSGEELDAYTPSGGACVTPGSMSMGIQ